MLWFKLSSNLEEPTMAHVEAVSGMLPVLDLAQYVLLAAAPGTIILAAGVARREWYALTWSIAPLPGWVGTLQTATKAALIREPRSLEGSRMRSREVTAAQDQTAACMKSGPAFPKPIFL